jgi:hypothetical protein
VQAFEELVVREMLVLANATRHDGHVVVVGEPLTELAEEVRRRLDSRLVVLVEDEEAGTARRHHGSGG